MRAREFGNRLAEALKGAGMSKLALSRELKARRRARELIGEPVLRKVDRPALYAALRGEDVPPLDTVAEMAQILGVRLGWLSDGEEPVEPDLAPFPTPIWLVKGPRRAGRPLGVPERLQARRIFQEAFLGRAQGFHEAQEVVRRVFQEILARRLDRRRSHGERGVGDPAYRASTAWSLYLKCFLDVSAELPSETRFSSADFTEAFLARVPGWLEDEKE
jgi:transcriptional regulator with XRE-family HTH domain